jgi:hypothetical protein
MPENFTFNRVKEILDQLKDAEDADLRAAIEAALRLKIRGPLAAVVFVKHHLSGAHEVEVDRIDEGEDGTRYAVLVYPEGAVPLQVEQLSRTPATGDHLRYDPSAAKYA